jgi:hypothetical protein
MKIGITYRLFLSILGAACVSVLAMFFVMQWSINKGFLDYLRKLDHDRLPQLVSAGMCVSLDNTPCSAEIS